MRYIFFLLALLTASPAYAGPSAKRLLSVMSGPTYAYVTTINGISSLSESGTVDTGTQTFTVTANPITVAASCNSTAAGIESGVDLIVDGTVRDSITCNNSSTSKTLTYTPTAASHTVQILGGSDNPGTATFSASSFRIPGIASLLAHSNPSYYNVVSLARYGGDNYYGQIATASQSVKSFKVRVGAKTGDMTGIDYQVSVFSRSGTALNVNKGSSTTVAGASLTVGALNEFTFASPITIDMGDVICVHRADFAASTANYITLGYYNADGDSGWSSMARWGATKTQDTAYPTQDLTYELYQ